MKYHGGTGGKLSGHSSKENIIKHKDWILDVLLRLVCILSLDRFGDYVSDQVINNNILFKSIPAKNLALGNQSKIWKPHGKGFRPQGRLESDLMKFVESK